MANDDDLKELNHATVEAQLRKMAILLSLQKSFREIDSQPLIPLVVLIPLISPNFYKENRESEFSQFPHCVSGRCCC